VLDRDNLADLIRQIGPNAARPLIQRLIAEGDDIIPDLAAGTASSGAASLATLCHRLSGSSGPFGTTGLRRALLAAETALKRQIASQDSPPKGDPDATAPDIAASLAELGPIWLATRAALLQELANLPEDADITTTDQKRRPAIAP
jgi:HPt (histidine-containing phosphotransfer) domain-containing protein